MSKSIKERFRAFLSRSSADRKARRKAIRTIGEAHGFVYFGAVDQHEDEHHVVRGFSASTSHEDDAYMVGAVDGIDVRIVDRSDMVELPGGVTESHQWLIVEATLPIEKDLPRFFLLPTHHESTHYKQVFHGLRALEQIDMTNHSHELQSRYTVYAAPGDSTEIDELFPVETTKVIAAHFWPFAIEIYENTVYLYSVETPLTKHDVLAGIKNSAWLAQTLEHRRDT